MRTIIVLICFLSLTSPLAAQTDECLTEINGAKKGGSGNIQDHMFHSLAIDPKNENIVYVGTETNGIFKTIDGGITWIRLRRGLKCTINQTGYSQIFDITIDPTNSNVLYASTINGPGPTSGVMYASASGGVYKSADGGLTWTQKVAGLTSSYTTYVVVDSTNPQRLYVGVGGAKASQPNLNGQFFGGGIWTSDNAGETWTPLPTPEETKSNIIVDMVLRGASQRTLYATGQLHGQDAQTAYGFYRSTDGGQTWIISNPPGVTLYGFDAFKGDPNILYGHDDSPGRKVHKSTDGGLTWTMIPTGSFYGVVRIHPTQSATVLYTGYTSIKKSSDGFITSRTVYDDTTLTFGQQMVDIKISDTNPNVVWAAAKGYYLYKSTDGGESFTKITAVREAVYGPTTSLGREAARPEFQLYQNHPNPFNPSTTIRYGITQPSFVTLEVFNMLGQTIARLVSEVQHAGEQSILWSANVPSGVYFYRLTALPLTADGHLFVDTKKMFLAR